MQTTGTDRLIGVARTTLLILAALVTFFPFFSVLVTSITPSVEVSQRGFVIVPLTGISFDAYDFILSEGSLIPRAYLNTLYLVIVGTTLSLSVTSMLAYGLSKADLPGGRVLRFLVTFTLIFNGGIIPLYIVVRGLGLTNSIPGVIAPLLVAAWNTLLMMRFFEGIPTEVEESARMDGANDFVIFARIVLPIATAALATIGLFYAVEYWNQWFFPTIFIHENQKQPLQVLLRNIITQLTLTDLGQIADSAMAPPHGLTIKAAAIAVTVLPIVIVYPFVQRYFVKGATLGAVKG
jgi:putative aldouronate transport system permease protein